MCVNGTQTSEDSAFLRETIDWDDSWNRLSSPEIENVLLMDNLKVFCLASHASVTKVYSRWRIQLCWALSRLRLLWSTMHNWRYIKYHHCSGSCLTHPMGWCLWYRKFTSTHMYMPETTLRQQVYLLLTFFFYAETMPSSPKWTRMSATLSMKILFYLQSVFAEM
jgi:hypothetical protein